MSRIFIWIHRNLALPGPKCCWHGCAGITLNNNLFETVLRELLVERAEFTVQIYEGSGTQWRKAK